MINKTFFFFLFWLLIALLKSIVNADNSLRDNFILECCWIVADAIDAKWYGRGYSYWIFSYTGVRIFSTYACLIKVFSIYSDRILNNLSVSKVINVSALILARISLAMVITLSSWEADKPRDDLLQINKIVIFWISYSLKSILKRSWTYFPNSLAVAYSKRSLNCSKLAIGLSIVWFIVFLAIAIEKQIKKSIKLISLIMIWCWLMISMIW